MTSRSRADLIVVLRWGPPWVGRVMLCLLAPLIAMEGVVVGVRHVVEQLRLGWRKIGEP